MLRKLIITIVTLLALVPTTAGAATVFFGEFWDARGQVRNLATADAIIALSPADATFTSTSIDYPNGSTDTVNSNRTSLADFLGADAASIVGAPGVENTSMTRSVMRWTGFIDLQQGEQTFEVQSDDGFRLTIGNSLIIERNNQRGFRGTTGIIDAGEGRVAFELIFFENGGSTGVEFFIDNTIATPAIVPLPASLPLLLAGFGGLAFVRRRT